MVGDQFLICTLHLCWTIAQMLRGGGGLKHTPAPPLLILYSPGSYVYVYEHCTIQCPCSSGIGLILWFDCCQTNLIIETFTCTTQTWWYECWKPAWNYHLNRDIRLIWVMGTLYIPSSLKKNIKYIKWWVQCYHLNKLFFPTEQSWFESV